ncbi:Acyl-CoA dehydrogenase [Saccharopolyspora antimicrobica]|uniref:Acyl-CoA dehydrogenase n=1 Tax=Saccharopolyspora antimicrobica TaxID=455193 RepID=A0A1I4RQG8_9PSEU|nr:acyl-CoA dehydrogenase family protein [Saccharopolyspora antimicrobica]RKT87917.1 alkylation response protein AidB-like acyl-CoA dehydrogenase [Saccharopolyspora antimicrobica]SFM54458.1 Acyl-CoA dehydrogenase [Saccharopolyspora antimicrobica]
MEAHAPLEPQPEVVARAAALRDQLASHRDEGERLRRLPDATIAALDAAGLFRAWVPRRFGGTELGLRTMVDATAEITKGDASAGWLVMILGCGDWLTGLFPDKAQQEVFGPDPDTKICQVLTPKAAARRVDGGWRVSGRWAPASGCLHSEWAMLGMSLPADGGAAFALVPMSELSVEDTWFTLGMRGTGSNMLVGEDVFVPDHRVMHRRPATRGEFPTTENVSPRYRTALVPTLATFLIAPVLGLAEHALEHVLAQAGRKGIAFTSYAHQLDSTGFQLAVAEAATKIDVARLIMHRSAATVDGHALAGTHPDLLERTRLRQHSSHALQQCREAVDVLVNAYGAGAMSERDPLHAVVRDVQTAARHALAHPVSNAEIFGRALLGVEPGITEMI